jgi:hypothetical protein
VIFPRPWLLQSRLIKGVMLMFNFAVRCILFLGTLGATPPLGFFFLFLRKGFRWRAPVVGGHGDADGDDGGRARTVTCDGLALTMMNAFYIKLWLGVIEARASENSWSIEEVRSNI